MKTRLRTLAALLLAGFAYISCIDPVVEEPSTGNGTFTMTVTATKDAPTKALAENNDHTLTATWAVGEQVTVYNDSRKEPLSGYLEAKKDGATTTLQGSLTGTIAPGDDLILKFLSPNYATQNGTLTGSANSIDKVCDYAEASVKVQSVAADKITTTQAASFVNKQAIVKFTLTASDGTTPLNTTQLTVSDGTSTVSLTGIPASSYTKNGNGVLYVAFPAAGSAKTITLNVADGSKHYVYEKSGVTFTNGKFYEITVKFGALSGAGTEQDPYLISSEADWNYLADKVNSGTTYAGQFICLTADIGTAQAPLTRMIGIHSDTQSNCRPFSGTFNGQGHTLTIDYSSNDYETRSAPFSRVSDATIRNLIVAGNCGSAGRAAGIVGECGSLTTVINCVSSVTVSGGPFIGGISIGGYYHIEGCLFNGTINATGSGGGLVGYGEPVTQITNCLFAPQAGSSISGGTFYHNGSGGVTLTNSYYQTLLGDAQGKQARSITAGAGVTISGLGAATGTYDVSGITAYTHGITYNGVYYAGNGEEVSLSLSHSAAPSGYTFTQYTVSGGGTLANPTTNSPTLTMTDANQTINVRWAPPGTINSLFTINAGGDQVYFSKGNLHYTSGAWNFFDNQWDYYTTYSADSWDKFGWSTSATTYGMSTSTTTSDYSGDFVDWGATIGSGWHTLTSDEWTYVFNTRTVNGGTGNGKSYTLGQSVNGKLGIVIYPDNYTGSVYSGSDWASFEAAGCVFLPAAGYRSGTSVGGAGNYGCYWSSTLYSSDNPYHLYFHSGGVSPANNDRGRNNGYLVRLVRQVE